MITKSIVDLNLIASFANAFEMPFVTPWFPEKTGGGFFLTGQVGKLFWQVENYFFKSQCFNDLHSRKGFRVSNPYI